MCRLFALRASEPTRVRGSLVSAPHSLVRQSCCDAQHEKHDNGWGIGWWTGGEVRRVRSAQAADHDPQFRELAEVLVAPTVLAHVRQASVGTVAERNSHPFLSGNWLFAHNGTLEGFGTAPERLQRLLPAPLRQRIEGDTDSEHAFALFLSHLDQATASADGADPETACQALGETIRRLHELYPGEEPEPSTFNFVVTDGRLLLASRWGRSLWWLQRREKDPALEDRPVQGDPEYQAIAVASEPTTAEPWAEVPERTILVVRPDLTNTLDLIGRQ